MNGVLPDFSLVYDSCTGIYAVWAALLCIVGMPALSAVLYAEARGFLAYRRNAALLAWTHVEETRARATWYTCDVNTCAATPVLVACAALAVSSPTPVPVQSRAVETIGQGCEGSAPVALDSLRPTRIIPCTVRGVCRYRDAATGRFVRCNAADLPV